MKLKNIKLAIVGSKEEVRESLRYADKNTVFFATNLEAEFYLEKLIYDYKNPIYEILLNSKTLTIKNYIFDNFKLSYRFCRTKYVQHFRDRLGYFLAELERSIDLADQAIKKYKPNFLIIGELKNYPGSSVVDGTLKTNAFLLLAKEKSIPYRLIGKKKKTFSIKQSVGSKIQLLRYLKKQTIPSGCDLLILATPRHLIQMTSLINKIKAERINVSLLTYGVTVAFKRKLDKSFVDYLEKERLIDSNIKKGVNKVGYNLVKSKMWNKFSCAKYRKRKVILNYIKSKIEDIVKKEVREIIYDIFLAEKIFSKLKPKALLTTTDPDSKILPYINTAKENKIKTISIQHGAFYANASPAIYPASDFFITWSKLTKNWLVKSDYFRKVRMLVGSSPFHGLHKQQDKHDPRQLTILFLSTKNVFEKSLITYYQRKLFSILSEVKVDFRLLVRIHPYQNTSNLKSLMENFNHQTCFDNDCSLEESIKKSDLVVYDNTTAGLDAMLFGKPTIYFNPYTGEDYFNVGPSKASFLILNGKDIDFKLPKILTNKKDWLGIANRGQKFAQKYLGLENSQGQDKLVTTIVGIFKLKNA